MRSALLLLAAVLVSCGGNAFDNRGVAGVLTFIDGVQFGDEDTAAPYISVWNTATATNGGHVLTATARDAAGYVGTSPEVMVVVSGGT